jgi:hypothetical protein
MYRQCKSQIPKLKPEKPKQIHKATAKRQKQKYQTVLNLEDGTMLIGQINPPNTANAMVVKMTIPAKGVLYKHTKVQVDKAIAINVTSANSNSERYGLQKSIIFCIILGFIIIHLMPYI